MSIKIDVISLYYFKQNYFANMVNFGMDFTFKFNWINNEEEMMPSNETTQDYIN